jgi:hypothetical protein
MKLQGPYVTLVGGLAVAGVLLALSTSAVRQEEVAVAASSSAATEEATAPPVDAAEESSEESGEDAAEGAADESADAENEEPAEEAPAPEPTPGGTYAGSVKGGGASVAIAVKGDTAIAYVCDGKKVEAWLQGSAADAASLSLTGEDGAKLSAKYTDGRLSGTVRAGGQKWTFGVKSVKAPSGLYRAARNVRNAKVVGGWIVYNGTQVGMLDSSGVETPAPPIDLDTGTVTIDGTTVQTAPVDGAPLN